MAIPVLPESAPFTPAQRAWLNGFFAGVLSLDLSSAAGPAVQGAAPLGMPPMPESSGSVAVAEAEEDFPWHDPTLPIAERLALAEGRPRAAADGRHGAARLRYLRLPLQNLCAGHRSRRGARPDQVHAGRPGNREEAEGNHGAGRGLTSLGAIRAATERERSHFHI